ncbi:MAG: response regulator transcription factor [Bacteroidetes bacterium]|jgi:DNA-binding NarL/FixJ family response regulator|nr:response regulator transcription factor [Bacteroidota bacterium]
MKTKVCLFDDNNAIRNSIQLMFEFEEQVSLAAVYSDCNQVVRKIKECGAKVVIMDIQIPPINGIAAVKEIRKELKDVIIIMFTVFEDDDRIFESICAGADGYLLKNTSPIEMTESIIEALRGGAPMSPSIARKVLRIFKAKNEHKEAPNYELTPRELEILKHLTQGLSYKMISDVCHISFETTRSHIKNVYNKLQVASMTEAVIKAINEKIV